MFGENLLQCEAITKLKIAARNLNEWLVWGWAVLRQM
jgi:hypothetical protein